MIYNSIIIGAGAAGLMAASKIKGKVLVLEKNKSAGKKLLVTGGGNCNFTNQNISKDNYFSNSLDRVDDILKSWSRDDAIEFFLQYGVKPYEKEFGKIFSNGADKILKALMDECKKNNVEFKFEVDVKSVTKQDDFFIIDIGTQKIKSKNLIIATGGKSYSNLGATDFGLKIAKDFKFKLVQNQPALVGLKYPNELKFLSQLAGVSLPVKINVNDKVFEGSLLFAHYGITGPVVLKASLFVNPKDVLEIDFAPKSSFKTIPARVLQTLMNYFKISKKDRVLQKIKSFKYPYITSFGYEKAEVMRGGVGLDYLNLNLGSDKIKGMYFIGEVLDITGSLGGYNLHMAFATAILAAEGINKNSP